MMIRSIFKPNFKLTMRILGHTINVGSSTNTSGKGTTFNSLHTKLKQLISSCFNKQARPDCIPLHEMKKTYNVTLHTIAQLNPVPSTNTPPLPLILFKKGYKSTITTDVRSKKITETLQSLKNLYTDEIVNYPSINEINYADQTNPSNLPENYRSIDGQTYCILHTLSHTDNKSVCLALDVSNGEAVVITSLYHSIRSSDPEAPFSRFEKYASLADSSEGLLPIIKINDSKQQLDIIQKWCEKGDLIDWICSGEFINPVQKRDVACQILKGIQNLLDAGFLPNDIKPDNILIDADLNGKLGDLFSLINKDAQPETSCYKPPEKKFGEAGIVWQMGLTLYLLFQEEAHPVVNELKRQPKFQQNLPLYRQQLPWEFKNLPKKEQIEAILTGFKLLSPKTGLDRLIVQMLSVDPNIRPSLQQVSKDLSKMSENELQITVANEKATEFQEQTTLLYDFSSARTTTEMKKDLSEIYEKSEDHILTANTLLSNVLKQNESLSKEKLEESLLAIFSQGPVYALPNVN